MINYLLQQISSMETQTVNSYKKANELSEKDRETAQKRLLDLKMQHDGTSATLSELVSKVNMLQ